MRSQRECGDAARIFDQWGGGGFGGAWDVVVGAGVAVLGGVADLIDGKIARLDPDRTKFGASWDSSLDRYGDAFLIAGIGYFFSVHGQPLVLAAAMSAMVGSFEISYVRARAEGLGFDCRVGFWERGERWVLLVAGLIVLNPAAAVGVLAILTHATAFRRIWHIRSIATRLPLTASTIAATPAAPTVPAALAGGPGKWSRPLNWLHAAAALAVVFWFRQPV